MPDVSVIDLIGQAVAASPDNAALRMHLAGLLLDAGRAAEARLHLAEVRRLDPADAALPALEERAAASGDAFDWADAEAQIGDIARPAFVQNSSSDPAAAAGSSVSEEPETSAAPEAPTAPEAPESILATTSAPGPAEPDLDAFETERPAITLADVGGLAQVKKRLNASFLVPMKNPELTKLYRKSLRGGLLLYGPPGCGKTYLARAIAGELGASFITATASDLFNHYIGESEKALHALFETARREAPCVLFLDEIDGIGAKRSSTGSAPWLRIVINQLLTELDGVTGNNEGVYVLAATNQPWDVDPALRRPGRLDRTLLVLPPDAPAREAIFGVHLRDRPVQGINLAVLAKKSEGLSGADIAYVCELAAENALMDSIETGEPRLMGMADLLEPLGVVQPSIVPWLESARTVVSYGTDDGTFAELKAYLKTTKRW